MLQTRHSLAVMFLCAATVAPLAAQTEEGSTADAQPAARSPATMSDNELLSFARVLRERGNVVDARNAARAVIGRDPRNLEALIMDGELAVELRPPDTVAAQKSFSAALKIQQNDFRANFGMGKLNFRSKVWRTAAYHFEAAVKSAPPDKAAEAYAFLAQSYRGSGQIADALKAVQTAISLDPKLPEARQVYISMLQARREYDTALLETKTLIEITASAIPSAESKREALATLAGAHNIRLSVLREMGIPLYVAGPEGLTDKVIPGRERDAANINRQVVDELILMADLNRTISYFSTLEIALVANKQDPNNVEILMTVGMLQRNTYQLEEAAATFRRVLELDPTNDRARQEIELIGIPASQPTSAPASQPAPPPLGGTTP